MGTFLRSATGSSDNIIGGPARILIAPTTTAIPTTIGDIINISSTTTNEVQSLIVTGTPTGGTVKLIVPGVNSVTVAYNAAASAVQAALASIGVTVTAGGGPLPTAVTLTYANGQDVPQIVADASGLTGGTSPSAAVTTTTPGTGLYDAKNGWVDLGSTKNGIQIVRNNSEQAWSVDQVPSDIRTFPTAWEQSVRTSLSEASLSNIAYTWETLQPTFNATTGEEYLGIGAPTSYPVRRLAVLFQKVDENNNPAGIRAHIFRKAVHTPQESSINFQRDSEQVTLPVSFKCLADDTSSSVDNRFGFILNQR